MAKENKPHMGRAADMSELALLGYQVGRPDPARIRIGFRYVFQPGEVAPEW